MRHFFIVLTLAFIVSAVSPAIFAEESAEGILLAEGKLTQINVQEKFLRSKKEKGPELTYFLAETTEIVIEESPAPLESLAVDDSVEIEYLYDKDYRKVLRRIRKLTPPQN